MNETKPTVRSALGRLQPYSPGKPIWEVQQQYGLASVVKLASNENPLGPSPKAIAAIAASLSELHRYPDAAALQLKERIAEHYQIQPQQVIVGNGADELITLISETFLNESDEILIPSPSFSEYEFGAALMGASVIRVPLDDEFQYKLDDFRAAITPSTKIVYLCSPHNPTGTYISQEKLVRFLHTLPPHVLAVIDSAYSHYAEEADYTDGISLIREGASLIVLQTFSKIYGLAGIRLGFAIAPQHIIEAIHQVKEPFNSNLLAQIAGAAALADEAHIVASRELVTTERKWLYEQFHRLDLCFTNSSSNFILVEIGDHAQRAYQSLLEQGVIVRFGGTWGLPRHLRITVGTRNENERLIAALSLL